MQQESDDKIKRALKGRIHEHKIEEIKLGDKVYYRREKEKMWREPAVIIGRDEKNVIVKYEGMLREVAKVHVTRIKGEEDQEIEIESEDMEFIDEEEEDMRLRIRVGTRREEKDP